MTKATVQESQAIADLKLSLKLLVDKEKNRVVFAESQRDFVDVLFSFLTLPAGTIIRVLKKQSLLGCMDRLYESVEEMDLRFMETKACKSMLLHPRSAAERACEDLRVNVDDTISGTAYRCPNWDCCTKSSLVYSPTQDAICPNCGLEMAGELEFEKDAEEGGVFVKGEGSFLINDCLHVIPASIDATLSALQKFGANNSIIPEEMNVEIRREEVLNLLKRSLLSDTPLTDVFLRGLDISSDADKRGMDQIPTTVKREDAPTGAKRLKMKLLISKSRNIVLHAEAGGDVVDFLFSFLTFPIGSVVKLLDRYSCMGCLDNLYKSVVDLVDTGRLVHSHKCANMLLYPELAPMCACASQLLNIQEEISPTYEFFGCKDCCSQGLECLGTKCKHGVLEPVILTLMNPKLPNSGKERGGRFTKEGEAFMITDELNVTPFSTVSSINIVSRSGISPSDLVAREVSLGEAEALKLLKASLISKRVLSNVFCNRKRSHD